ncbi:MAG TPA: hypothetical protein VFE24_16655 [Pirellulales bacterium]|jgi:hypothetical protein|nr:hypothetical protein [Pirellulales bacterium]
MNSSLSSPLLQRVQLDRHADHLVYRLPREPYQWAWVMGALILGVAIIAYVGVSIFVSGNRATYVTGEALGAALGCIALSLIGACYGSEVELRKDQVVAITRIGPFVWRKAARLTSPDQLEIKQGTDPKTKAPVENRFTVRAHEQRITPAFPAAWCEAFREELIRSWSELNAGRTPS